MKTKYRVGILGAGYIADWHCKALEDVASTEVVAVADIAVGRAQAIADKFGISRVHDSLDAMLEQGNLDAIHILLPPFAHRETAAKVLRAGIHCFVEKPMCISSSEADQLYAVAEEHDASLGINHNFLFHPAYERLREDYQQGLLGRIDSITVTWNKVLPQLWFGPFDTWMLQDPGNLMLEIGPHVTTHLLDLLGQPNELSTAASFPLDLPRGKVGYRHWTATASYDSTIARMEFSFAKGPNQHQIDIRGSHGRALVDLEDNFYLLDRSSRYAIDIDRYQRVRKSAKNLLGQARKNLFRYVGSKAGLSKEGNSYGVSILRAVESFYEGIGNKLDSRLTSKMGGDAIGMCERMITAAKLPEKISVSQPSASLVGMGPASSDPPSDADNFEESLSSDFDTRTPVLVIGGTGFIGQQLVSTLINKGHRVRLLARKMANIPDHLLGPNLDVIIGTMTNDEDLDHAIEGVDYVYHLARANVKTWEDYVKQDIEPSTRIAEKCLEHGVKRLIYTGTIDSYYAGGQAGMITEETGLDSKIEGRNYYAQAKAEIEKRLEQMHKEQDLPVVIMRPGIVIGPGGSPFHWGVGMWCGDSFCQTWGKGENPLPLVLAEDVADALVAAIEVDGIDGESFNLVADPMISASEYLQILQSASGVMLDVAPTSIGRFYSADMFKWFVKVAVRHPDRKRPSYRDWESRTQLAIFDCTKAKERLNWKPNSDRHRLIEQGIEIPTNEAFA